MFNNVKYKINEEVHEPLVIKSSELRSSSKECVEVSDSNPTELPTDSTKIFTDYIISYKSQSLIKKILGIPMLITTIIKFINNI